MDVLRYLIRKGGKFTVEYMRSHVPGTVATENCTSRLWVKLQCSLINFSSINHTVYCSKWTSVESSYSYMHLHVIIIHNYMMFIGRVITGTFCNG